MNKTKQQDHLKTPIKQNGLKLKLINPFSFSNIHFVPEVARPLGFSVLTGFLKQKGICVEQVDLNAKSRSSKQIMVLAIKKAQETRGMAKKYINAQKVFEGYRGIKADSGRVLAEKYYYAAGLDNCDIAGIGILSMHQMFSALLLAEMIKEKRNIPVVVGGCHVTLFSNRFFMRYPFLDYAVVGEGEIPLLKLLQFLQGEEKIENVPALLYRKNGRSCFNKRKFFNIEQQAMPDYDDLDMDSYNIEEVEQNATRKLRATSTKQLPYITSRGCFQQCSFCVYRNIDGPWQPKSLDKVVSETKTMKDKYGVSRFKFEDANLNASYERIEQLCDKLIESKAQISWVARLSLKNFDLKLAKKMKKAGAHMIFWGLESASDRILEMMGKAHSSVDAQRALAVANEAGIRNVSYIILDYPQQMPEDLTKTLKFLKSNRKNIHAVGCYNLAILPGSELFNLAKKRNVELVERWNTFFSFSFGYREKNTSAQICKRRDKVRSDIISYADKQINAKNYSFLRNIINRIPRGSLINRLLGRYILWTTPRE